MIKPFIPQLSSSDSIPLPSLLQRVDYGALLETLRFPIIWVYENNLQTWLPREIDLRFLKKIQANRSNIALTPRLIALGLMGAPFTPWSVLKAEFEHAGFVVIRQLFPAGYCSQLSDYFYRQPELIERFRDMDGIRRTSMNNSPLMRLLHQSTEVMARNVLGDVKTSYSFTASYEPGTILPKHTDRPQCVYNASIMLGSNPSGVSLKGWPLFIDVNGLVTGVELDVGDAVFYPGTKHPHWRTEMPPEFKSVLGTFFHYVPSDFSGSLD